MDVWDFTDGRGRIYVDRRKDKKLDGWMELPGLRNISTGNTQLYLNIARIYTWTAVLGHSLAATYAYLYSSVLFSSSSSEIYGDK